MRHFVADYDKIVESRKRALPYMRDAHRKVWAEPLDLPYLLAGVPLSVSRFTFSAVKQAVSEALAAGEYHALLLFDMHAIPYCPSSSYRKLVVNIEDPQFRCSGCPAGSNILIRIPLKAVQDARCNAPMARFCFCFWVHRGLALALEVVLGFLLGHGSGSLICWEAAGGRL